VIRCDGSGFNRSTVKVVGRVAESNFAIPFSAIETSFVYMRPQAATISHVAPRSVTPLIFCSRHRLYDIGLLSSACAIKNSRKKPPQSAAVIAQTNAILLYSPFAFSYRLRHDESHPARPVCDLTGMSPTLLKPAKPSRRFGTLRCCTRAGYAPRLSLRSVPSRSHHTILRPGASPYP
jgi:hypothetical protein